MPFVPFEGLVMSRDGGVDPDRIVHATLNHPRFHEMVSTPSRTDSSRDRMSTPLQESDEPRLRYE